MAIRKCYTLADNVNEESRSAVKMLIYKTPRGEDGEELRCPEVLHLDLE